MKYVVVVENKDRPSYMNVYGPYTAFKQAEGDAKAWSNHPWFACVLPLKEKGSHTRGVLNVPGFIKL